MNEEDLSQPNYLRSVESTASGTSVPNAGVGSPMLEAVTINQLQSKLEEVLSQLAESRQEGVRLLECLKTVKLELDAACFEDTTIEEMKETDLYHYVKEALSATPNTKAYAEIEQAKDRVIEEARRLNFTPKFAVEHLTAAVARLEEVRKTK